MKKAKITFTVSLDEDNIPEKIEWSAPDGGIENSNTTAVLISVWDPKNKEALQLDLWTKEMPINEMKKFFHQTFISMGETYERATGEEEMKKDIFQFAQYFADKSEIENNS